MSHIISSITSLLLAAVRILTAIFSFGSKTVKVVDSTTDSLQLFVNSMERKAQDLDNKTKVDSTVIDIPVTPKDNAVLDNLATKVSRSKTKKESN